jgi:hypothetical protein
MTQDRRLDNTQRPGGLRGKVGLLILIAAMAGPVLAQGTSGSDLVASGGQVEILLDVLASVESGNNPSAVGDHGHALGLYQIHRAYWEESTQRLGVDWPFSQAFDPDKARCVVRAYLLHHGCGRTLLDVARIHNGGPNGYRRRSTLGYARRVDRLLIQRLRDGVGAMPPGDLAASVPGEETPAAGLGSQPLPALGAPQVVSDKV